MAHVHIYGVFSSVHVQGGHGQFERTLGRIEARAHHAVHEELGRAFVGAAACGLVAAPPEMERLRLRDDASHARLSARGGPAFTCESGHACRACMRYALRWNAGCAQRVVRSLDR